MSIKKMLQRFSISIKRNLNRKRVPQLTYQIDLIDEDTNSLRSFGSIKVYNKNIPLGKLTISASDSIYEIGKMLDCDLKISDKYLRIDDVIIHDHSWRGLGIGRKLVEYLFEELDRIVKTDYVVFGWVQPPSNRGFWSKFGFDFKYVEKNTYFGSENIKSLYMCKSLKKLIDINKVNLN